MAFSWNSKSLRKKITFKYEEEETHFHRRTYDSKVRERKMTVVSSNFTEYRGQQQQLKAIIFDEGKIIFKKDEIKERLDLKGGHTLASIEIENKNELVKKYQFNYSYSHNDRSKNINYFLFYENEAKKRLFLDSIQTIDKNNDKTELYRAFEYTNKNDKGQ